MQRTKIIATIGPASGEIGVLKKMVNAGMDAARLNLSHNNYAYHQKVINNIRRVEAESKRPLPIILDLQGPKIRIGEIAGGRLEIKKGQNIILVPEKKKISFSSSTIYVPIQFTELYKHVKTGQTIYVDDAAIELKIIAARKKRIECRAENDGVIKSRKSLNVRGLKLKMPILSAKDLADLEFGVKNKVDFIALSYVGSKADLFKLRQAIGVLEKRFGYRSRDYQKPAEKGKWSKISTRIIAKIEKPHAIKNFNEILETADAVMVARGDLGLEIPIEDVPLIQKEIIAKCLTAAKPVIVATQMLNSMISQPNPTRAEVSDVANAVLDGADAIMLSGESAIGKYPVKSVRLMDKIARGVELTEVAKNQNDLIASTITAAVTSVCKELAEQINARAIICVTTSGYTARSVSRLKLKQPIIALTPEVLTRRQLNISWGVYPYILKPAHSFDALAKTAINFVKKEKIVKPGDKVIIVAGHPVGYLGQSNLIKVEII